ncbi:hypothetical protein P2G74_01355 [Cronobacter muytjensii]|uniref:hypothetical protein n=1 Tax=Cronobacter muytjensii TaxID=413501 RepID=UPI002DBE2609|nr:hypothetical protein [Cronobacter muytjensii]MEB8638620.1 hypothetical protein [Cronobacter muytjensii]
MTRDDAIFDIHYSHYLEQMFATITGRIDRMITFIIILSGCGVFISITGYPFFGAIISALSIAQINYQFSKASGIAEGRARKYLELITDEPDLTDAELLSRLKALQDADSWPWGSLKVAAHKRTCIVLEREDTSRELTRFEAAMAWLAGDLPR